MIPGVRTAGFVVVVHVTHAVAHPLTVAVLDHADGDFVIVDAGRVGVDAGEVAAATEGPGIIIIVGGPVVVHRRCLMCVCPKHRIDDKGFRGERGV